MLNKLREKYAAKEVAVGTFFNMGDMSCLECLGYTGMDFVIIDCEHGPYDTESMMDLIRAAESVDLAPVVRIANADHKEIQRAADCGAQALIVPCLRSVEEFKKVVNLGKYPPLGNRGFIKGRGCGFGNQPWAAGDLHSFMANSNEKLMLLPQCETVESLEHIEEIAAMEFSSVHLTCPSIWAFLGNGITLSSSLLWSVLSKLVKLMINLFISMLTTLLNVVCVWLKVLMVLPIAQTPSFSLKLTKKSYKKSKLKEAYYYEFMEPFI